MSKTLMIEAVKQLDVDAVRELLATGSGLLSVTDRRGLNLLHLACCVPCADLGIAESQSAKMVSLLLDHGLDVESKLAPEQDRCTALFFAVARGRNATLIKGGTLSGSFSDDGLTFEAFETLGWGLSERQVTVQRRWTGRRTQGS